MATNDYRKIIELVLRAAELARTMGINNLLQPGLIKEMIIAEILGHEILPAKHVLMPMLRTIQLESSSIFPVLRVVPDSSIEYSNPRPRNVKNR
jgi:hypothetical protein